MRFVIVGAGDVGVSLSKKLTTYNHEVVLVEKAEERLDLLQSLDLQVVHGNGCSPDVLIKAGLKSADYFVAVTDNDEINIAACLISKLIHPETKRICRIQNISLLGNPNIKEERIGDVFDLIINPAQAAAQYIEKLFTMPGAKEITEFAGGKILVVGLTISRNSSVLNKKLHALKEFRDMMPVLILAIMRGNTLIVPRGSDTIRTGDVIYCITTPDNVSTLFKIAGKEFHEGKNAIIWGGTPLGTILAKNFEKKGINVKLIVSDEEEANTLAAQFKSTLVLHGKGTDHNLLIEEHISECDSFIAATQNEEDNILSALLAKRLGARTSMVLVNRGLYKELVAAIGVDAVISVRVEAASAIFKHIHPEYLISDFSLRHRGAGFVEIKADKKSVFLDKPIKDLKIPHGMLIACIIRDGKIFMPRGNDEIKAGDYIIVFVMDKAIKAGEKVLGMKLKFLN